MRSYVVDVCSSETRLTVVWECCVHEPNVVKSARFVFTHIVSLVYTLPGMFLSFQEQDGM